MAVWRQWNRLRLLIERLDGRRPTMQVNTLVCSCLFRIALPTALLTAVVFRYNFLSLIYLLLLLILPLLPGPTAETVSNGHTGRYLRSIVCLCIFCCLSQVIFQIVLLSLGSYGSFINYCDWTGQLFAIFGLHRLDKVHILDAVRLVGLDFLVLFTSIFVYITCTKLQQETSPHAAEAVAASTTDPSTKPVCRKKKKRVSNILLFAAEFLIVVFLAGAGILQPSVLSCVYFFVFLVVATWLACNKTLGRKYVLGRMALLVYCALHFIAVFVYQSSYFQEVVPPESLYARLFGLSALTNTTCENARTLEFLPASFTVYVSPLVVLGLYWLIATVTRYRVFAPVIEEVQSSEPTVVGDSKQSSQRSNSSLMRRRRTLRRERAKSIAESRRASIEETPLLEDDHHARSYKTLDVPTQRRSMAFDPNGSVIWSSESEAPDGSCAADEATVVSVGAASRYKHMLSPFTSILKLISKGSYVATLIIMMTWSITYHSWLTFILLLWSCILWMTPNSRQACLRSAPALVAYAEALLLLQYLYGLNLNDDELPKQVQTVNLGQIGLVKYYELSYQPLAVKILYTVMFWLTLHQFVQEKTSREQRDISAGVMLEPFHISYSTAQPGAPRPDIPRQMSAATSGATPTNAFIRKAGVVVMKLLTKYWIWVVACMLMVISLGGQRVVLYRIAYMFLFLFFIIMFQISYQLWRRIMYGFWLTVIVYSMLVLTLIYTYQFENFEYYWETYLKVSPEMQKDIGLEVYKSDPGTLFLKLLTPTFFLIITIIQLHYFHKEFLTISHIDYREPTEPTVAPVAESNMTQITIERDSNLCLDQERVGDQQEAKEAEEDETGERKRKPYTMQEVKQKVQDVWVKASVVAKYACELIWRFLEIHIIKIVLFSVLCLAVYDVCAIHFVFVVFVIVALPLTAMQTFLSHCCSVWASVLLLSKMIYQLHFVDLYGWMVNCTSVDGLPMGNTSDFIPPFNETIDNRIWIGFKKTNNLTDYCKGYIGLILVLTIQAVVRIRQTLNRYQQNESQPRTGIIFLNIIRAQADEGLLPCTKYLLNFFFYKFGIEFCFVTMVACIGVRLDVFSLISCIWLLIMFLMRRHTLAKIWPFYVAYQCIVLPIQYLMCIGIPPGLCIEYPWAYIAGESHPFNSELREWLFLPDFLEAPNAYKILVDFFQLLFACCQLYVFTIETGPASELYEGGSNKEIHYGDTGGSAYQVPNPVPDFVTYTKSYLDMIKSLTFFASFWVTLAIVFLSGTNRISLLAMGYVIGCFIFLWNGNEFYLKPIRVVLKMWDGFLTYNVVVIFIKSLLQVLGCVFHESLHAKVCWLVQLLGIACLKKLKFGGGSSPPPTVDSCESAADDAGLLWDGICFGFLLLQRRLFCSHYFQHIVNEIRAQQILASRGAELIHEIQMKEVKEQKAKDWEDMEKIKKKMDAIRARHQTARRDGIAVPADTHFDGGEFDSYSTPVYSVHASQPSRAAEGVTSPGPTVSPSSATYTMSLDGFTEPKLSLGGGVSATRADSRLTSPSEESYPVFSPPPYPLAMGEGFSQGFYPVPEGYTAQSVPSRQPTYHRTSTPSSHHASIRSGDYYMFDEYSDDELDIDIAPKSGLEEEDAAEVKEKGLNALLSQAMKGNLRHAVAKKGSEEEDDLGDSSQMSAIISADRSLVSRTQSDASQAHPPISRITSLSVPETIPPSSSRTSHSLPPYDMTSPPPDEEPPKEESLGKRMKAWLGFALAFLESALISATARLNAVSKDYRYVARHLSHEKRTLKEKFASYDNIEDPKVWEQFRKATPSDSTLKDESKISIRLQKGSQDLAESVELLDTPDALDKDFQKNHPTVIRFLIASFYAIVSRSELVCYLIIIVNQMKSASLLSLPLPLMAFLWGSLSVPRPSKSFWITIITYTEAIVVIKYVFQFGFFQESKVPLAAQTRSPFDPPTKLIGIDRGSYSTGSYDLALLLVVFFHRFMLKSLGLWKDTERSSMVEGSKRSTPDKDSEPKDTSLKVDVKSKADQKLEDSVDKGASGDYRREDDVADEECLDEEDESLDTDMGPSLFDIYLEKMKAYLEPCKEFYRRLLHPDFSLTVDVYAFMFFCDFINFLIVVFGYWAFGTGGSESSVASYFQENKVPIPFLVMLIAQFGLIVIDRALYLRKYIFGKLLFQIALVFVVHLWMFFILPVVNETPFNSSKNLPPKLWYFIKCIYLLLSSYQIRSGYPTRILGNFFCKKYNYINLFLYKGYLFVPFLYELRCLMDWIWTDTSMNVSNWLKMEDIFSNIFLLKCQRRAEEEYPTPRGSKRTPLIKYGVGGFLLLLVILIIWFPLLLFALGNTVGKPNPPVEFGVMVTVAGYEPLLKMTAQQDSIKPLTEREWERLLTNFWSPSAQNFLTNYDINDVRIVNLNGNSTATWSISPPSQQLLITELLGETSLKMTLSGTVLRDPKSTAVEKVVMYENPIYLTDRLIRNKLAGMLNGTASATSVTIDNIFPNFLKAVGKGVVTASTELTKGTGLGSSYRSLKLSLIHRPNMNTTYESQWWEARDPCSKDIYKFLEPRDCHYLQLLIFSDKVFPSELSILSGYGIVGLYTTFVLLVSRLIRGLVAGTSFHIMFDDMPNVDRVLQLCVNIYLVRESGEFTLEEDLFAKLIFLYRSPETLIKWTRYREVRDA